MVISVDPESDILTYMNKTNTIFLNIYINTPRDLTDYHLRFDSLVFMYENDTLFEAYQINMTSILSKIDLMSPKNIWERRSNLQHQVIKAVYAKNVPYVFNIFDKTAEPQGTNVDIIKTLAKDMNFSLSLYEVSDGKFGAYDETKQLWNGVMGDIVAEKADISIAGTYLPF